MTENYIHLLGYSFGESGIQACLGGSSAQDLTVSNQDVDYPSGSLIGEESASMFIQIIGRVYFLVVCD